MIVLEIETLVLTGGATWDALVISQPTNSVAIQNRDASAVKMSHQAAGTLYSTIKSGNSFSVDSHNFDADGQTLYFNGTGTLEVVKQVFK